MKRLITILFFVDLLVDLWAINMGYIQVRYVSKPLLMCILALLYCISSEKPKFWFLLALFFSFLGDVFLLFPKYFIYGLVSFLIMHLIYVKIISNFLVRKSVFQILRCFIPFAIFFGGLVSLIYSELINHKLLIPVIVYGTIISMFGTVSLVNYLQDRSKTSSALLIGAILFIISDSLIAIDLFYASHLMIKLLIMLLYGVSQYVIYKVMLKRLI